MNMHWCVGKVNLSGQGFTVLIFDQHEPISWPEAQVLMTLHGEENVFDVKPCRVSDASPTTEKNRLIAKYGYIVERVFPGRTPRMEMLMPGETEDQPRADENGEPLVHANGGNGNGDDGNGDDDQPPTPEPVPVPGDPPPAAVFKQGKHQPPRKGA